MRKLNLVELFKTDIQRHAFNSFGICKNCKYHWDEIDVNLRCFPDRVKHYVPSMEYPFKKYESSL